MAEQTPDGLRVVGRWQARGDEIGADGTVPATKLLSWLEHGRWCALEHGEGFLSPLFADGNLMVVRVQRLALGVGVGWQDRVKTGLGLARAGNSSVELAQSLWTDTDEPKCVAELRLVGVALGPDRRPRQLPEEVRQWQQTLDEPRQLHGLALPELITPDYVWQAPVRASEIDLFHHVNHARYADWLQDSLRSAEAHQALPQPWQANRPVAALAIDYVREVVLGETVSVALHVKGAHDIQMLVTVAGQLRARAVLRAR